MTKSPDSIGSTPHRQTASGEQDPTFPSASAGDRQGHAEAVSGAGQSGGSEPSDDEDGDLALEVEVEPPEPSLEQRISELESKQKETYDRYIRSVAELDNFRKRTRKEIEDARIDAQSRVLREMLPVIDNLERALAAAGGNEAGDGHSIIEGVRLVLRQFAQALERCGVTPVIAQGAAFDPTEHEAVSQLEIDTAPPGTVVGVLQSGYRIGDRLLRPALVVVAKAPPPAASANQAGEPTVGDDGDGDGSGGERRGDGSGDDGDGDDAGSAGPNGRDPEAA
jgi:molecular chaperone GrpE